jgi:hypothetical protein
MTDTLTLKNTTHVVNAIRYTVKSIDYWRTFVAENGVTLDTVAVTANALAVLAYPNEEPVQRVAGKRTRYGNAVQAAAAMLRKVLVDALPDANGPKTPDYLALAVQAARTAHDKGEIANEKILKAIKDALKAA